MSTDYLLPQLPFGSAEIMIVRWLKRVGDTVAAGEPLLVVMNDRIEAALPATGAGIVERALVAEGALVTAGALLATIAANSTANIGTKIERAAGSTPREQNSPVRISPVARNIVKRDNIDIIGLQGTGVAGRIMKSDVLAAPALGDRKGRTYDGASPVTSSPACPERRRRVTRHSSLVPYVLTTIDVDLERVATLIVQHRPSFARRRLELNYIVCVALAAVAALPYHPLLNSYWADTMIVARRRVHLAVMPCDGTPPRSVCDAQNLNLRGLARGLGGATAEPTSEDHTFTIVDLGDQVWGDPAAWMGDGGSLTLRPFDPSTRLKGAFAQGNQAQGEPRGRAAALGLGAVRVRPLVITDGGVDQLAVRHAALLTLAYDARVFDHYYADAFLCDIKRRLEQFHL
jgi:2-oxoglutarate dehydrogenase E2 component (dihydrolipoamide succinyltransferase)